MAADICFTLDKENRIIKTNAAWELFAHENGAPELTGKRIHGKPLFSFITDDVTRMHVRLMLGYVRTMKKTIVREYRCDSDRLKRFMQMKLTLLENGQIELAHTTLRVEPLTPALAFHYKPDSPAAVLRCSNCNSLRVKECWQEPESAQNGPHLTQTSIPTVYTICDSCQDQMELYVSDK
ncbi:MAG: hypothetical protein V2I50_05450 [Desulfuromusa sp.]|jgi:hypothetical protein|nr:hypothetical protein [Desulfuromusa sp.]